MAKMTFGAPVSQTFTIKEGKKVFGTLRVRPSGVLWKPRSAQVWYALSMDELGVLAVKHGTQMAK
jgi:hypothetical protein